MRKLICFNMVTLDGFFSGPNGEIDWHKTDEEFNDFAIDQLGQAGGLLFGRVTYQLMASYWPTAGDDDPIVAGQMNTIPKVVFSHTLDHVDWNNTRLVKDNAAEEVARLKQQPGGDLFIFGSANFTGSLLPHELIDEYRLIVNPIVLGSGRPVFEGVTDRLFLELVRTRTFQNGNILLVYRPKP